MKRIITLLVFILSLMMVVPASARRRRPVAKRFRVKMRCTKYKVYKRRYITYRRVRVRRFGRWTYVKRPVIKYKKYKKVSVRLVATVVRAKSAGRAVRIAKSRFRRSCSRISIVNVKRIRSSYRKWKLYKARILCTRRYIRKVPYVKIITKRIRRGRKTYIIKKRIVRYKKKVVLRTYKYYRQIMAKSSGHAKSRLMKNLRKRGKKGCYRLRIAGIRRIR